MAHYRLYFHDQEGHFARAEEVEADGDGDALRMAKASEHRFDVEVWERGRKVGVAKAIDFTEIG